MAGGTTFTGGWQFVQMPKYYEEAATGYASVITTATASGIFGAVSNIEVTVDPNTQEFRSVSNEDIYTQVVGKVGVRARMTFGIVNTSSVFLGYAVKKNANAAGDISRAIHIVWSQRMSETGSTLITTFFALRGAKPNRVSVTGRAGTPLSCDVDFICHSLTFTAVASAFQSTFAIDPTDAVWNYEDGGVSPVTIFGNAGFNVTEFDWSVDRGLKDIYVLGQSTVAMLGNSQRGITGSFTAVYESASSFLTDSLLTQTTGNISWVMKTGSGTPVFSTVTLTNWSLPQDVAGESYERIDFKAVSMSTF